MPFAIHEQIMAMPEAELKAFFDELSRFITVLAEGFEALTPKERQRKMKMHAQRASVVPDIMRVATIYKIDSRAGAVKALAVHQAAADRLQTIQLEFFGGRELLEDMRLANEDETWRSALAVYAIMKAEARRDPLLADALAPIQAKLKRKKKRAPPKA